MTLVSIDSKGREGGCCGVDTDVFDEKLYVLQNIGCSGFWLWSHFYPRYYDSILVEDLVLGRLQPRYKQLSGLTVWFSDSEN